MYLYVLICVLPTGWPRMLPIHHKIQILMNAYHTVCLCVERCIRRAWAGHTLCITNYYGGRFPVLGTFVQLYVCTTDRYTGTYVHLLVCTCTCVLIPVYNCTYVHVLVYTCISIHLNCGHLYFCTLYLCTLVFLYTWLVYTCTFVHLYNNLNYDVLNIFSLSLFIHYSEALKKEVGKCSTLLMKDDYAGCSVQRGPWGPCLPWSFLKQRMTRYPVNQSYRVHCLLWPMYNCLPHEIYLFTVHLALVRYISRSV